MIHTALQTITWGDPQHQLFPEIFRVANQAGFGGLEIGYRRLSQVPVEHVRKLLNQHDLRLSGCHVGGNLADLAQAETERAGLAKVLATVTALDARFVIYSGLKQDSTQALGQEIEQIRLFADLCADQGVRLLYHNHDWEFRDNRLVWRMLGDAQIQALQFALDLGWAARAKQDLTQLLTEVGSQAPILHFKDFSNWHDDMATCHLGQGVIDFAPAWRWIAAQSDLDLWATAEQDFADDADQACAANAAYLQASLRASLARGPGS